MARTDPLGLVVRRAPDIDVRPAAAGIKQSAGVGRTGTAENLYGMRPTAKSEFTRYDRQTMAAPDRARGRGTPAHLTGKLSISPGVSS